MKKILLFFTLSFALFTASAAEAMWLTDLSKAQALAKAEKKLLLIHFTGSDW